MQYFFITGTSQGIGKALAEKALQLPETKVIGFSRSATLEHSDYDHHTVDLSDISSLKEKVDQYFPSFSSVSRIVMINNAGTLGEMDYIGNVTHDSYEKLINLNVTAPIILINQFLQTYQHSNAEKIVINVSSGAGKYPVDGWSGYCTSKAALDMFTQVASVEQEKQKNNNENYMPVRFYALAPGTVDTSMQGQIRQTDKDKFSTIDKFINLKKNNELSDPQLVSDKFFYLLDHPDEFEGVIQDVRKY